VRVGLLGGTFDPIHNGHLAAAEAARRCAGLDEVLLVPAGRPPHKRGTHAPARDRLEMCRLAARDIPGLRVWDVEVARPGLSYTVDTLLAFRSGRPQDIPYLLLGWDAARQIRTWHDPVRLVALADMVIFSRPGLAAPAAADLRAAGLDPERVVLCLEPTPDVTATQVRRRAAQGRPLDGLVPPTVAEYIAGHGLYRTRVRS